MKLTLLGHTDNYAVEQLQMALFPENPEGEAVSTLHRGKTWLTATAKITINGKTTVSSKRLKAEGETVPLRRRILQLLSRPSPSAGGSGLGRFGGGAPHQAHHPAPAGRGDGSLRPEAHGKGLLCVPQKKPSGGGVL